jgi:hypothetical protein
MTELLTFLQVAGIPGAIALVLILNTGPRIDKLTIAILSLGTKLTVCPLIKPANPEQEANQP